MPQEAVEAPSWPELWGPGPYRTPGPQRSLQLCPPSLAQGVKGEVAPHPRACTSARSTSVAGGPACGARRLGALLSHSASMGCTGAWLMPSQAQEEGPCPCPAGRHCFPSLAARPASVLMGPLQALAIQPFPLRGARARRGVSSSFHGPLLPSHIQGLGSAKQVQATQWPQRGLQSATSTSRTALVPQGVCLQILPTRPAER